jgi:hypothetical protein
LQNSDAVCRENAEVCVAVIANEPTGRANARLMTGSAASGALLKIPHIAFAHAEYGLFENRIRNQGAPLTMRAVAYRGARLARMRCRVRRCMLSRRAVSETLRLHIS